MHITTIQMNKKIVQMNTKIVQMKQFKNEKNSSNKKKIFQMKMTKKLKWT